MSLFDNPFSLEIPVRAGNLNAVFFINENLFVTNAECISPPHNHHDFEIRYIATGACNQLIDDRIWEASAQDLLLVHPLEYHCQTNTAMLPDSTQYNLRFTPEPPPDSSPASAKNAYNATLRLLNNTRRLHDDNRKLLVLLELLAEEIHRRHQGFVSNIQSICSCILVEILRLTKSSVEGVFSADELEFHGYGRSKLDEFFRHKYLTDVKVQDLANDMKVSTRQVNRVMNRMFGMSFTQKITEMRLHRVAVELTQNNKPIQQICLECGFTNYTRFFSSFRKEFGMTPGQYRADAAKKKPPRTEL
ncbi:MAG: helix-turn-helix domain-containing protein [Ruminococcaceae bacterium]|nr:helix-turn-helix domain-containing protein [Oscillospiraceae bacterium]